MKPDLTGSADFGITTSVVPVDKIQLFKESGKMSVSAKDVVKFGKRVGFINSRNEVFELNGVFYHIEHTGTCWGPKDSGRIVTEADNLGKIKESVKPKILSLVAA